MKYSKKILSYAGISLIVILSIAIIFQLCVVIYVTLFSSPSIGYRINKKRGFYPTEKELGDSVWRSQTLDISLTIIDDKMYGEITVNEKTFYVDGYFFFGTIGFNLTSIDEEKKEYLDKELFYADYKYINGKIEVTNIKSAREDFTFNEDFVLEKEKDLNDKLFQTYKCREVDMLLKTYDETDALAHCDTSIDNGLEIQLDKRDNKYYFLKVNLKSYIYIVIGTMEKQDNSIVFTVSFTEHIGKENELINQAPYAQYFNKELKTLTFEKVEKNS